MTFKEFFLSRMQVFFFLVTMILLASVILGSVFAPQQELRYYHLLSPVIIAALCVLPTMVTFSKKEPSLLRFLITHLIELVLIEGVVMIMIAPPEDIEKITFYIILGTVILVIYVLVELMMWFQKVQQSKKLTEQLKLLQQSEESSYR